MKKTIALFIFCVMLGNVVAARTDLPEICGGPGKSEICAGYIQFKGCTRHQCIHKCFVKYSGTPVTEAACDSVNWCLCCYVCT
ncbi:hypothetical protein LguiA_002415 [Lonicera macranthoides]